METTVKHDSLKSSFPLSQWLLVAVVTGVSGIPAWWYLHAGGRTISPLWITAGVATAFFARYGWRAAPAVVVGHLAPCWLTASDRPLWAAFGLAMIFTAEAWLVSVVAYRSRRMAAAGRQLAAVVLCAAPCALLSAAVLNYSGGVPVESVGNAALLIALSHALGIVGFGGLTLHLLQRDFSLREPEQERNGALAGIAALAVTGLVFHWLPSEFPAVGSGVLPALPLLLAAAVTHLVALGPAGARKGDEAMMALGYQKAKLHSLQANLSPHFLFNTLNIIRALVYADPAKADHAITSLAGLLRRSLRTSEVSLIDLGDELEHIKELLQLARLRYRDRLQTHIHVPEHLLEVLVPPMLLFNLVENAITHGIGSLELGGTIKISARLTRQRVRISIRNSGTLDGKAARGNGTNDALQRLEMLFGGAARFSLSQIDEKTVSADVDLPLSHNHQL